MQTFVYSKFLVMSAMLVVTINCSTPDNFGGEAKRRAAMKRSSTMEGGSDAIEKKVQSGDAKVEVSSTPPATEDDAQPSSSTEQTKDVTQVKDVIQSADQSLPPSTGNYDLPEPDSEACSKGLNREVNKVVLAGNNEDVEIMASDVLAIYATGNQVNLDIDVAEVAGICIFGTGNYNTVSINLNGEIGGMYVSGSGNETYVDVNVNENGGSLGNLLVDAVGNQTKITVLGNGVYDCDKVELGVGTGRQFDISCRNHSIKK